MAFGVVWGSVANRCFFTNAMFTKSEEDPESMRICARRPLIVPVTVNIVVTDVGG
jgi:hypothetical protein